MKKFEGKSIRKVKTDTGKIPNNVGFPSGKVSGGGYIRPLTIQETEAQKRMGAFVVIGGKIFNGTFK